MPSVTLEVRPSNTGAIALYEASVSALRARARGYYRDTGEDALIMWRTRWALRRRPRDPGP